jgi:hypothetical protein
LAGINAPIDVVVMQGQSLEATSTFSNPAGFVSDVATVFQQVRMHSPNARAVLYHTWARGPGHGFYASGTFGGPAQMHGQIAATYAAAVSNLEAQFGAGAASRAAAGDAFAEAAWNPLLYASDLSHPSPFGQALAALLLFEEITGVAACEIPVDFASTASALSSRLAANGVTPAAWFVLAELADAVEPRHPGAGEDFRLSVEVDGVASSCPVRFARTGELVTATTQSPMGNYAGVPFILALTPFATGMSPTVPAAYPELVFDDGPSLVTVGPLALPASGFGVSDSVPAALAGTSLFLQSLSLAPSAILGNPFFTASNAVELRFLP